MSNIINIGGTSGGSGSSVVANPQGAATDTLNKLQVDGTIYGVSGGGSSGHNYSTTEQVVGTWVDGSTIYEKTIFGTTEQSAPETQVNHGINNLDTVVSIEGSIRCGTQYQTLFEHSRPSNEEFTRISDTVISIVSTDGDWRGKPFHIILRYTKTTT